MSVDMLERLKAMASGDAPTKAKAEPKVEAKQPKAVPAKAATTPVVEPVPMPDTVVPVVVLDDHATFSNLRGCRICWVSPDAEDIDAESLANGVDIDSLLTLRDAVQTILRIVQQ